MRHFFVILLIVTVLTVCCMGFNGYTDRMIEQTLLLLEQASSPEDFKAMQEAWKKQAIPASLMLDHDELAQFETYLSEMEVEVETDPLSCTVTRRKAKDLLCAIRKKAHFSWESVF